MLRNTSCEQLDLFQQIAYHRIPKNNILLKIDSEIFLEFTNDLLADKYNKAFGRPAWKPEIMIRIGILQRMYNLSDEAVIEGLALNRAYEHFCHLSPVEELPHASTLCKFRKMRLDESTMDDIMTEIVRQMVEKGIIKNESGIGIDSTHIHANTIKKVPERLMEHMAKNIFRETADKQGLSGEEAEDEVKKKAARLPRWEEYTDHQEAKKDMREALEDVIAQADPELDSVEEARDVLESELFIEQKGIRSLQDKDARVGRKDRTTNFFGYKSEFMMTDEGIITGMTVQPGNYRDGDRFKELLEKTKKAGLKPNSAYGDKAYCRPDILEEIKKLGAEASIPISHSAYRINEDLFTYNKDSDTWTCIPMDKVFLLSITEANKYFSSDEERKCATTGYSRTQGVWTSDIKTGGRVTCRWWLRSPGNCSYYAACVSSGGSVINNGASVNNGGGAVRPALWIDLEQDSMIINIKEASQLRLL